METEWKETTETVKKTDAHGEENNTSPVSEKEEKRIRKEESEKKKEWKKTQKSVFRAIWKTASHRRRLRAASALLCIGAFGIAYVIHRCLAAFGVRDLAIGAVGEVATAWIMACVGAVFSIFLLYPLWLGMLSYAEALWMGETETDGYLFSYYSERRFRRFAFRQGAFHAARFGTAAGVIFGCVFACFRAADTLRFAGENIRAAFVLALLAGVLLAVPAWFLISGADFSLTRSRYREDASCSVFKARRRSCRDMRGHRWDFWKLVLSSVPGLFLSFVLFGVGIPLWVIPKFVLHAAGFSAALHMIQEEKKHGKRKMLYHNGDCLCVKKAALWQYI